MVGGYERQWETRRRGGRSVTDESRISYYGVPVIHRPHWKWLVIFYFFFGGLTAASYVVATIAQLFGGVTGQRIAIAGRYVSLVALLPCPPLLVLDLGRPERFHHMLRVFKLRSPMSVGTWGLVVFSVFSALSALLQALSDGVLGGRLKGSDLPQTLPARILSILGMGPAFFMGGYTAVLLAATAVPLWTKNHLMMGPLFLSSALSNATAAIALVLSLNRRMDHEALKRLERLDSLALLAELGLLLAFPARLGPVISRPLVEGRLGQFYRYGILGLGITAPLVLQFRSAFLGAAPSRLVVMVASMLVLAGGFLFRYLIVMAGRQSADEPAATFELTRADGQGAGARTADSPPL